MKQTPPPPLFIAVALNTPAMGYTNKGGKLQLTFIESAKKKKHLQAYHQRLQRLYVLPPPPLPRLSRRASSASCAALYTVKLRWTRLRSPPSSSS
jgi:hypothetical protein